jgi:hypothetical protein
MSMARVLTPTGDLATIPVNETNLSLDYLRTESHTRLHLTTNWPLIFRERHLVPCNAPISTSPDLSFSAISKSDYPEKEFARCDYGSDLDRSRFPILPLHEDFPDPGTSQADITRRNERITKQIGELAQQMSRPWTGMNPAELDLSNRLDRRRPPNPHISNTEEEDGGEFVDNEEEDDDGEMHTEMEERLSNDYNESVERLVALGFDHSMVRLVLTIMSGDEQSAKVVLNDFLPYRA